jgi:hypothetical protein
VPVRACWSADPDVFGRRRRKRAGDPASDEFNLRRKRQGPLVRKAEATYPAARETSLARLAELFPDASPVRIAVQVTALRAGAGNLQENTVIEFGTPREILFASGLPLEFDDKVRVTNSDRSLDATASVVAVQYYDGRKAVAARFLVPVGNWIIQT